MMSDLPSLDPGAIPKHWEAVAIGDLNPFITSGSRGWAEFYSEGGAPFVRITNMSRESIRLDLSDLKLVTLPPGTREGTRTQLRDDDVLISITADVGIVSHVSAALEKPAYINQHIAMVRFDPAKVSGRFVSYFLATESSRRLFRGFTDQGAKTGMNLGALRKILIQLPPVLEQRAIATALEDMDDLLAEIDQIIAKKRDIKLATMQQLLTGQRRLSGFYGDWTQSALGELSTMRTGPFGSALHKSDYACDCIPIVNPMHIIDGKIVPTVGMSITPDAAKLLNEFLLRPGDIVIGRRGDMGRCAVVAEHQAGWLCGTGSMIVRPNAHAVPEFLQRVLSSGEIVARIEATSVGSTMINLNQKVLRGLSIQLPPVPEQVAIAAVLSDMDAEISALEARRAKSLALKQGMMQALLTGRTRLV